MACNNIGMRSQLVNQNAAGPSLEKYLSLLEQSFLLLDRRMTLDASDVAGHDENKTPNLSLCPIVPVT
jgi:hypothetical protein